MDAKQVYWMQPNPTGTSLKVTFTYDRTNSVCRGLRRVP
jgi:hypothetical protein